VSPGPLHRGLLRPAGVGKTLSARQDAHWSHVEAGRIEPRTTLGAAIPPALAGCHTLGYTAHVATTPRRLGNDLGTLSLPCNELMHGACEAAAWPSSPR
jgi:hypothetical protein